nr:hypothetical protein Iba_chr02eCG9720 [Ipomoea batatas]
MQGEGQINENELIDVCVHDKQVETHEGSNMQVVEPVASHIVETTHEEMLEEHVMIPSHSHAMVQIVESIEELRRISVLVERPVMETEEISVGGCEISKIPAKVEVEELATTLATVPIEQQNHIIDLQNELSALRRENVVAYVKVDKVYAKVDKIDGNVELLIYYVKKGEGSSHLALNPSFSPTRRCRGRERERSNGVSGFIQFAGTTGPKFSATEYFREDQPKYTLNYAPPVVKKQPKKDRVAWVMKINTRMEKEALENVSSGFVKECC